MKSFVKRQEFERIFRPLTTEEAGRFDILAEGASDILRQEGKNRGIDIDEEISEGNIYAAVARQVTADLISRVIAQPTDNANGSQYSLSDEVAMTVPVPQMKVYQSDLKKLGILRQRIRGAQYDRS